jgi:hypothetical protein
VLFLAGIFQDLKVEDKINESALIESFYVFSTVHFCSLKRSMKVKVEFVISGASFDCYFGWGFALLGPLTGI